MIAVKPLEWVQPADKTAWISEASFSRYFIFKYADDEYRWLAENVSGAGGNAATLEAAKASAQADYERRILSALEPSPASVPAGAVRVTEEMVEALREYILSHRCVMPTDPTPQTRHHIEGWNDALNEIAHPSRLAALCQAKPETDGQERS